MARSRRVNRTETSETQEGMSASEARSEHRRGGLVHRSGNEHGGFDSVEIARSCEACGTLKETLKELNVKIVDKPYFERNRVLLMGKKMDDVVQESGCDTCDKAEKKQ